MSYTPLYKIHVIMACANYILQLTQIHIRLNSPIICVSMALNLFNMKRQPSGDEKTALRFLQRPQHILVHIFISNINFKGAYL